MHGFLELIGIYVQADGLSIHFMGQAGVAMASEAIVISRLRGSLLSGKGYHRIERNYGNFVRSFAVPNAFDTEKIAAAYKNGVLSVSLPKKEAAKPRQVKVEVNA